MSERNFSDLLKAVTTEPGKISKAYSVFWDYSLRNQLAAMFECASRGIELGPIASFKKWQSLGRQVKRGEKAIPLCMPVTCKREDTNGDEVTFNRFVWKNNWFALSQTDGADYVPPTPSTWDKAHALKALEITEVPFQHTNGNVQGYATLRKVAVSPLAALPHKTLFHELAHVILGHTAELMSDSEATPRNIREVEAECTAMLCCAALELPGLEESRGYVQGWYGSGEPIPEASANKILSAADKILKAGRTIKNEVQS